MEEGFDPNIDPSPLLHIDVNAVERALHHISFPKFGEKTLGLSDLDAVDWDAVASSLLGISDPIGQLEQWLPSVLDSFFSDLKNFISSALSPISDAINGVSNVVSTIKDMVDLLINQVSNVIVTPILNALNWVSSTYPKVVSAVNGLISTVQGFITTLPDMVKDAANRVSDMFNSLASKIQSGLSTIIDQLSKVPGMVSDLASKVTSAFSDLTNTIRGGLSSVIDQVSKLPDMIKSLKDSVTSAFSDLSDKVKGGLTDISNALSKLPGLISDLKDKLVNTFSDLTSAIKGGLADIQNTLAKLPDLVNTLKDKVVGIFSDLANTIKGGLTDISNALSQVPNLIKDLKDKVTSTFSDLASAIKGGLTDIQNMISKLPNLVSDLTNKVTGAFSDLKDKIVAGLGNIADQVAKLPDLVNTLKDKVVGTFSDLADKVKSGLTDISNALSQVPNLIKSLKDSVVGAFSDLADKVKGGLADISNALSKLPGLISDLKDKLVNTFSDLTSAIKGGLADIQNTLAKLPDLVNTLKDKVVGIFSDLANTIKGGLTDISNALSQVPNLIKDLKDKVTSTFSDLASAIKGGLTDIQNMISKLPNLVSDLTNKVTGAFSDLKDKIVAGLGNIADQVAKLPDLVNTLKDKVVGTFSDLADKVKSGLTDISNALSQVPNLIKSLKDSVVGAFSDLADKVKGGLADISNALAKLPGLISDLKDKVMGAFSDLADKVKGGFSWFIDQVTQLPDRVRDLINNIVNTFSDMADKVRGGFAWFIDQVSQLPDRVRDITSKIEDSFKWFIDQVTQLPGIVKNVTDNLIGDVEQGVGGIVGWIRSEFENFRSTINSWFTGARDWFESATQDLKALGAAFMGFVNAVQNLPSEFENILKPIIDFFENALNSLKEFAKDPQGWLKDNLVVPVANAMKAAAAVIWDLMKDLGDIVWQGLSWLWNKVVSGVTWLSNKVTDLFAMVLGWGLKTVATIRDTFLGVLNAIVTPSKETQKEVEEILENALSRTGGVAENLWYIGSELVKPFWLMTIVPFIVRGLVNTIGDAEFSVKLAGTGGSWNIRLGELADALVHGLEMYYSGFGIGLSMGIANMLMVNIGQLYTPRVVQYYDQKIQNILGDVLEQEIKEGATINMFLKPVTEHELIDYARRMLAMSKGMEDEKTLKALLATVRAYLKIYGLPKWYIDFLTSDPEKLAIKFQDRFGAERKIYLSYIFELPTYSDLARMTQRDIFPDVKTMQKVGWVRGWNEDLTAMMYLLTFNYPSFEKLWSFYMRAVSGMLWFNPPDIMRTIYAIEANQLKAGVPVAPIDLQRALQSPDQVKAFELAINTYFKWMAYSSFSWFTPTTEVYGVNVGQEIVSRLGGWTADSWILADTAADIPGRIDLRWMSRYSIIQYMGDRFNASNVKFESYAPLVDAVPKLIDTSPASSIQLDLRWFSKLLQATGLHPAWVPIVSVAENIMAITDEMTLLRSGWLNLFKEGMINVTDAERYLSGLLVTSYQVGYWDPVSKAWTSGWINLPVRWLPHERRLIELRMAIDRVMDVFREAYNYIKSGIRTLSISIADARQRLAALIDRLNQHYRALTKVITGQEFELKLDSDYIDLWLYAQELAQDIEAVERVRAWWSRVSGYLLYRIMYGYVTDQDVDNFINTVANYIPLFPKEVEAYRGITKALFGIVRKESIPSPSTLATFAEYLVLDPDLIRQTLAKYNVPPEYWDLWTKYISVKPVKGDYKQVLSAALKALRYGAITQDYWESLLKGATAYGFTPAEISLIELMAELELAIDNAKEWRPSLPSLISMIEYVPEAVNLLDYYNVDPVFKPVVEKYAHVRPLADEVRALINEYFRAKRYTTIPSDLDALVMSIAKQLGFTDEELMLRNLTIELTELADNAKQWTPTPTTLATLSEYLTLPNDMILGALKAHRIPDEWINVWMQYITVKPLKSYYKSLISTALKALRYNVITGDDWKKVLSDAKNFGFTDAELELISKNAELELAIDNAKEYIPTPSTLAAMAEYVPEVKNYTSQVLQARNITGVWAELWTKYIYLRPLNNDLNKWANSMFTLAERSIIDMSQLDPVFKILSTYGWEDLEIEMARRTVLAEQIRNAFEDVIGTPRALAGMARYTDRAADWAFSRAAKLIDALPTDDNTKAVLKEMWKQYITAYQANDEIRSYMNELINAYAHGALDDAGLEAELDYLRKLGVPELRLALVRRTAYLRRARIAARG